MAGGPTTFFPSATGRLPKDPRHKGLDTGTDEAPDLDRQDFGKIGNFTEKFHDPAQLGRDHVGNKKQPNPPALEISLHLLPELLQIAALAQEVGKASVWLLPFGLAGFLELRAMSSTRQNCTALAAYSSTCPTTCRRSSGFLLRLSSASVGMASWSSRRWSNDHRSPDASSSGTPISRCTRSHLRGETLSIWSPARRFGYFASNSWNSRSDANGSSFISTSVSSF